MSLVETSLVDCPWCGEALELAIDCPDGQHEYVEDCHVCCSPILVKVIAGHDEAAQVSVQRENE